MKISSKISAGALAVAFIFAVTPATNAATAIDLGTAGNFALLAGSTITNTGSSVINGDLGLSPGTSVTGFPPGTLNGAQHVADATALLAQSDLTAAYNNAASQTPVSTVATELGGTTKLPGTYNSITGTFGITGALTLDAQGDPSAVFVFKTSTTLVTAASSSILLINGAQACNVFWQVGSSATLGSNSSFKGNILALVSATLTTGANVEGRVLSRGAAATLDTNTITKATCAAVVTPTPSASASATSSATATSSAALSGSASATATPKFPDTGNDPSNQGNTRNVLLLSTVILLALASALMILRKRRA